MQRKPGFPVTNSGIKLPECPMVSEGVPVSHEDETEQRRLQLINFGHSQWGFKHWSWSVTKQEVDFVDFANGKFCAGVVAFVNVTVKSFDIYRENVGYATSVANTKGFAVYKSRKCAVTNALRETLMSFGGTVAAELAELIEPHRGDGGAPANQPEVAADAPRAPEPRKLAHARAPPRRDSAEAAPPPGPPLRSPHAPPPAVKNLPGPKTLPLGPPAGPPVPPCPAPPANRAALAGRGPPATRPNSNEPTEQNDEDARAERIRRQRVAQEEFRLKQMMKQKPDEKHELSRNSSSIDKLLMDIPTQDIVIESTCEDSKRKSPGPDGSAAKRRTGAVSKLDIMK